MKFSARVISGNHIARKFGVPTANLDISNLFVLQETGVFASEILIKNKKHQGILFIGQKHFPSEMFIAEVFIFNFTGDLYGMELEVETKFFIRQSQKFKTLENLFSQIKIDIIRAKKFFLRRDVFQKWESVSQTQSDVMVKKAVENLSTNTDFIKTANVLIFAPIKNEISFVEELILKFPQKEYYFPRIIRKEIRFFESEFVSLVKDKLGILAPLKTSPTFQNQKNTIVIIPAVAADKQGNRLGRGGGFYDKFLTNFSGTKIVILPKFAIFDSVPVEEHDVRVDLVIGV